MRLRGRYDWDDWDFRLKNLRRRLEGVRHALKTFGWGTPGPFDSWEAGSIRHYLEVEAGILETIADLERKKEEYAHLRSGTGERRDTSTDTEQG